MALSDAAVRQAKPKASPYKLTDEKGMYLLVSPADDPDKGKRWRLKYRFDGKEKLLAIGPYPAVSVRAARKLRDEARELIARGVDPGEHRKLQKQTAQTLRGNTFSIVAEAWYKLKLSGWASNTAKKARTYLDLDLIPALGSRPITEIKRPELVAALRQIEGRDALDVAKKCRGWIAAIFAYAHAEGIIDSDPAVGLSSVTLLKRKREHHAHLPLAELQSFMLALNNYATAPDATAAVRLLLLTAVRPGELRGAHWSEFDLDAALWSVPAERMKMRRPHVVPLPAQAVAILRVMQERDGDRQLVFASPYKPKQPISENTINVAIGRMGFKGRQTGHGFRHLVSTALNEQGYNRDWIEKQLAHGSDDEIRDTYNKAQYLDQRRRMMQAWADSLDLLARGGNKVVAGNFARVA